MDTLETRQLLGYTLETFEIQEFKEYYDANTNRFNDFARKAFLKAISIPPSYFLEQPEETQDELLCNKVELSKVHTKYQGVSVLVVSKGVEILNAAKIKTNEIDIRFDAISSIEDVSNIVWSRSLIKDGYVCGYLVCGTVSREGYNKALFIDFPILFTKPTIVHDGFIKLANPKMKIEKDMVYYETTSTVDYSEFQHVAIATDHYFTELLEDATLASIDDEKDQLILKEPIEATCALVEEKVLSQSMLTQVANFIEQMMDEDGISLTIHTLTEAVISFDNNVKSIRSINSMRQCKPVIERLYRKESEKDTE